jgi:hypothetical protein
MILSKNEGLELADSEQGGDHEKRAGGKGGGSVKLSGHG